jgi:hypothetical protein
MRLLPATCLINTILGCLTLFALSNAAAENHTATRMAIFAKLPNWTGEWESIAGNGSTTATEPSFTAAWVTKRNSKKSAPESTDNAQSRCVWGMPRLLKGTHIFEVIVMPEQTFFSYNINEFRHVWTDGRKHPLGATITNTGHSTGHWEGSTLVIDTIAAQSGLWINQKGATLSPKASTHERWAQVDNDHLKVDVTIQDSVALAKPFAFSRRYQRVTDNNTLIQQECFEAPHESTTKDSSG